MINKEPIMNSRIRNIRQCTFGWIDHNFLHHGFLKCLLPESLLLYFFLCLVADRNGCSYYDYENICSYLKLELDQFIDARNQLIKASLIVFDNHLFQVLNLPDKKENQLKIMKNKHRQSDFRVMKKILENIKEH